ncbi:MAG: hypothetical protein OXR82_08905 [Gammaproteobacteria bacterium]|nr:hypothetical protein [Gammaproteobacteria bacterium]MDE0258485.1 hypothetical protein [Gammaproteobacteria bacterium]
MNQPVSKSRFAFGSSGVVVLAIVMIYGRPLASGNIQTMQMMVTAFSVMTGVLMALITVSGDPSLLYPGNARIAERHGEQMQAALRRYKLLFYAHLVAMTSSLVTATLVHVCPKAVLTHWLERWTFGIGAAALYWSFGLPAAMARAQSEKLGKATDARRRKDRYVLPDDPPFNEANEEDPATE